MKILIIGGNGFLGRRIVETLLNDGHEITAVVRSFDYNGFLNCCYLSGESLLQLALRQEIRFDVIVNVAMKRSSRAIPVTDEIILDLNFTQPLNLIRRLAHKETLVINFSTYIQNFGGVKGATVEKYGAAKELLSQSLEGDALEGGYKVIDLYLFTLYGPKDRSSHLVPLLIEAACTGRPVSLSEGNQLMNLRFIDDAVRNLARVLTMKTKIYSRFFCWEPHYLTVKELVDEIEDSLEVKMDVRWGAMPYVGHEMFKAWPIPLTQFPLLDSATPLRTGLKLTTKSMGFSKPN